MEQYSVHLKGSASFFRYCCKPTNCAKELPVRAWNYCGQPGARSLAHILMVNIAATVSGTIVNLREDIALDIHVTLRWTRLVGCRRLIEAINSGHVD